MVQPKKGSTLMSVLDALSSHAPILLSILRFKALVRDPTYTLSTLLPIVLALTVLPRALERTSSFASVIYSLGVLFAYFVPGTYLLVVLMGAPFTTHVFQTVLFSTHLAIMAFFRAITQLGLERTNWQPLVISPDVPDEAETRPKELTKTSKTGGTGLEGIVWGTVLGAYIGAVPIPLDWDRDWQKWPVTVHIGACLGVAMGSNLQLIYNYYRTRQNRVANAKKKKT